MIWRATQTDRDDICCIRGGLRRKHPHQSTRILQAKLSHQDACTCAHSVKTTSPVAPQMPPGFFCPSVVTEWPVGPRQPEQNPAEMHTHRRRRSSAEICCLPPEKQHGSCLSNWNHSRQQNKQALLHPVLYLGTFAILHHFCWNTGDSVDMAASDLVHQSMGSLQGCMWVSQPDAGFLKPK